MVYMLRIQMNGDKARELSADEHREGPPRHPETLDNLFKQLSITQKPDRVRPIYKSGAFLCYYNEESDVIVRELRRGVPYDDRTRKLFDYLSISFMILTVVGHSGGTLFDSRVKPRNYDRRSVSPRSANRTRIDRSRYTSSDGVARRLPIPPLRPRHDGVRSTGITPSSSSSYLPTNSSADGQTAATTRSTDAMMYALKVLQNSATMQALMKQNSLKSEVSVKKEEIETSMDSVPSAPPLAPQSMNVSQSSGPSSTSSSRISFRLMKPAVAVPGKNLTTLMTEALKRPLPPQAPPKATPTKPAAHMDPQESVLTRDLWEVRRQMTALRAKEDSLVEELRKINPSAVPDSLNRAEKSTPHSREISDDLEVERKKRKRAEEVWEDARREYRAPLVVPAMLDAFEKLARIAGDALVAASRTTTHGNELQSNKSRNTS